MHTNDTRPRGRRPQQRGGSRHHRPHARKNERHSPLEKTARKMSFWQKLITFFTGGRSKATKPQSNGSKQEPHARPAQERRSLRPVERVEVTSPKLYVGNLSYDATESDLFNLFKGTGQVQNAEIVTQKGTYQSKGFGFVTMLTIEEALRAVDTLHDQEFMGRRLVVCGSRSSGPRG